MLDREAGRNGRFGRMVSVTECKTASGGAGKHKAAYVLIVDENASGRIYTSMLIQRFGYDCCTAASGKEALDMAAAVVPALIVIDQELHDMKSLDLVLQIKLGAATAAVPVIVKGARIAGEDKDKYREAGAFFLEYPETAERLFPLIQRAIEATPRGNIRIRTRLPVTFDGRRLDCSQGECVSELSEHGMYIRTAHPCPPHQVVAVQMTVKDRKINVKAQVLYCHHPGEGPFREPGMGLKFTEVDSSDREFLSAYIREEIMRGVPEKEQR